MCGPWEIDFMLVTLKRLPTSCYSTWRKSTSCLQIQFGCPLYRLALVNGKLDPIHSSSPKWVCATNATELDFTYQMIPISLPSSCLSLHVCVCVWFWGNGGEEAVKGELYSYWCMITCVSVWLCVSVASVEVNAWHAVCECVSVCPCFFMSANARGCCWPIAHSLA